MAVLFSFTNRSDCGMPSLMNTAFKFSIFERQISSLMLAWSRMLPLLSGFCSRHCFAVMPNKAMFSTSASFAYLIAACSLVTSAGIKSQAKCTGKANRLGNKLWLMCVTVCKFADFTTFYKLTFPNNAFIYCKGSVFFPQPNILQNKIQYLCNV